MAFGFYQESGIDVPHPPIPLAVLLIVEEALRVAWQRLKSRSPAKIDLVTATEDEITHALFEILYDEVLAEGIVEGFDREHFRAITREPKIRNFDGGMIDKMPDLLIGIAGREHIFMLSQDGLFIECKPVDSTHTVGVHYAGKGIVRFIKGEYAWAMPGAMMIGYVSLGYSLDPKLGEALATRATEFAVLDAPYACSRSTKLAFSPPVHITRHQRTFNYIETGAPAPPIVLRHLWLDRM